jgi:hypothetical protein
LYLKKFPDEVFAYVSKFFQTHQSVINKFGNIPSDTVRRDIEKSLSADFGMFTHFFETIADTAGFKCPPLLHLLHCFSMEVVVAYIFDERKRSHKNKHPEKEVNMEDLTDDTNNANPDIATDMEVEIAKEDQSPNVQKVINTDEDFEPVISKSKRKWEKRKQKLREKEQSNLLSDSTILEKQPSNQSSASKSRAHASSKSSTSTSDKTTLTETKNKPTKAAKKDAQDARTVITGHEPSPQAAANVKDILVYDVPSSWTMHYLLRSLRSWGKVISVHRKHQKKYSTVQVRIEMDDTARLAFDGESWVAPLGKFFVRWFPAQWTLKERKKREIFQAVLYDVPDTIPMKKTHAIFIQKTSNLIHYNFC